MKSLLKYTFATLLVVIALLAFVLGMGYFEAIFTRTAGVAQSDARRESFTNTRAFTTSATQQLARYRLEYEREEDATVKKAILSTVRNQFSELDVNTVPHELSGFLRKARGY